MLTKPWADFPTDDRSFKDPSSKNIVQKTAPQRRTTPSRNVVSLLQLAAPLLYPTIKARTSSNFHVCVLGSNIAVTFTCMYPRSQGTMRNVSGMSSLPLAKSPDSTATLPWQEPSRQGLVGRRCTAQASRKWSWPRSRLVPCLWDRFSHLVAKRRGTRHSHDPCPTLNRHILCRQVRCLDLLRRCPARTASEIQLRSIHLFARPLPLLSRLRPRTYLWNFSMRGVQRENTLVVSISPMTRQPVAGRFEILVSGDRRQP